MIDTNNAEQYKQVGGEITRMEWTTPLFEFRIGSSTSVFHDTTIAYMKKTYDEICMMTSDVFCFVMR